VSHTPIPPLARIRQNIPDDALTDVAGEARKALADSGMAASIHPGMTVAVAVGSRGIANLPILVHSVIGWLRSIGAEPFIVPAMGSHGRATAEGQTELLAELGVTECSSGCSIRSSMEVVQLGTLPNGLPVYLDKQAHAADGIFVVNRVKPHTSFRGRHESGLIKMISIGLGKQIGADSCHSYGFLIMPDNLINMAAVALSQASFIGGLATVENADDKTCLVEAIPASVMVERDAALLEIARTKMPSLPFAALDVLIVDELGKNISGSGMDCNVIGRYSAPGISGGPVIGRIAVLDVTDESHGNAMGMGFANFITWRLRDKIDFEAVYANALTSTVTGGAGMPVAMATDLDAVKAAIKTCWAPDLARARIARIKNTLEIGVLQASAGILDEARARGCTVLGELEPMQFTQTGELHDRSAWAQC
jgi:hypothetical protein